MSSLALPPDATFAPSSLGRALCRVTTACFAGSLLALLPAVVAAQSEDRTTTSAAAGTESRLKRLERLARRDPSAASREIADLDLDALSPRDNLRLAVARSAVALFEFRIDDVLAETAASLPRARALGEAAAIAALLIDRATALDWKNRGEESRKALDEATVWADRSRDADLRVDVRLLMTQSAAQQGRFEEAFSILEVAEDVASRSGQLSPQAGTAMNRALLLRLVGDMNGALEASAAAERAYRDDGDPRGEMDALKNRAGLLIEAGRYEEARLPQQRALAYFIEQGQTLVVSIMETEVAVYLARTGKATEALRLSQKSTAALRGTEAGSVLASALVEQMNMLSGMGRTSDAARLIPEIEALMEGSDDLKLRANLQDSRATVLAALGRHRDAYEALRERQLILARLDDTRLARQLAAQRGRVQGKRIAAELEQAINAAEAERAARDRAEQRSRWLWGLIGIGLFLLGGAVLALRLLASRSRRDSALAKVDYLTGVSNRRRITELGDALIASCQLREQPLSVILIDIDHFKAINDKYGHAAGDRVLKEIAATLQSALRRGNELGRFGGEEFAVLLPGTQSAAAMSVAERLRSSVAALSPERMGIGQGVTLSAGVASSRGNDSFVGLIARADAALYEAKQAGRNSVRLAESEAGS